MSQMRLIFVLLAVILGASATTHANATPFWGAKAPVPYGDLEKCRP